MNNSTIVKGLIGLALTGGTAAGVAYATLPKSKLGVISEDYDEEERNPFVKRRKSHRITVMTEIFRKHTSEEARKEIATIIGASDHAYNTIFHFLDNKFYEDGIVINAIDGWCSLGATNHETLKKYEGFSKENLCDWKE